MHASEQSNALGAANSIMPLSEDCFGLSLCHIGRRLCADRSEHGLDLAQARLRCCGSYPDHSEQLLKSICQTGSEFRVLCEHCRNGIHCAPLIEQQHEELLAK